MNAIHLLAVVLVLILTSPEEAHAFGTKRSHQELADRSITKADAERKLSANLETRLGLRRGIDEPLAIQFGLAPEIDEDLIVDDDPTTSDRIETRLNRSLSRLDEDEKGKSADRPLAPGGVQVFFQHNCREALDFDACVAALPRANSRVRIRTGAVASLRHSVRLQSRAWRRT